jgi:hypothetical protein
MEQILINLIAGALGGVSIGKSSPTFGHGVVGNMISGLVRRRVAQPDRSVVAALDRGRSAGGQLALLALSATWLPVAGGAILRPLLDNRE